jgi:fatty-acid desaturase
MDRVCSDEGRAQAVHPYERNLFMLGIVAAVLFFLAFLVNAADIATNDVFSSTNIMLLGLMSLALHVAGIGTGWARRR